MDIQQQLPLFLDINHPLVHLGIKPTPIHILDSSLLTLAGGQTVEYDSVALTFTRQYPDGVTTVERIEIDSIVALASKQQFKCTELGLVEIFEEYES